MTRKENKRKHHFFRNLIIFILVVLGVWYIGTFTLKTTEVTIQSDKINDDVTIVQLTDLHGAKFGENNYRLIKRIDKISPDIIVVTGDMYTSGDEEGKTTAITLLSALAEKYKVFFVNGEHDNNEAYLETLKNNGVDVLDYETRDVTIGNTQIRLYGISNVYYSDTFDLDNAFSIDSSKYNVLLAHISNSSAFSKFGVDLSICGDTHGGQIRLPYFGGLTNGSIWLPEKSSGEEKYVKGLYQLNTGELFVSSGLGNFPYPIRFFNRPEVAVIHLTHQ